MLIYGFLPTKCLMNDENIRKEVSVIVYYVSQIIISIFTWLVSLSSVTSLYFSAFFLLVAKLYKILFSGGLWNLGILCRKGFRTPWYRLLHTEKERQPSDFSPCVSPLHYGDWYLGILQILALAYWSFYRFSKLLGTRVHVYILWIVCIRTKYGQIFDVEKIYDLISIGT